MNGYELVRSQPSHDEMVKKVKDFLDNGGVIGGAIKGVTGTTGHRFLEHTGVFNGRNALLRTSTANTNGYPAIINMIEDKDIPDNGNGFVFTLGNGKSGDQYRNSFLRPISKAYGSGSVNLGSPTVPWDDLWLGKYSKSKNGYTKLPNGLILQWGEAGYSVDQYGQIFSQVKFPISFPNATLVAIPINYWESGRHPFNFSIGADSYTLSGFRLLGKRVTDSTTQGSVKWIAIGY